MKGISLLVALAALGVNYDWRITSDNQREYIIQMEPAVLQPLAEGQEIQSDVPPDAGQIQRLCIRLGMTPVPHTAAGEERFRQLLVSASRFASRDPALTATEAPPSILWPARANPEQAFGVTHGWQPNQQGELDYFVQIDPAVLRTLSEGDEIYAAIDPAAGRVGRFVVSAGTKRLPQVAAAPGGQSVAGGAPLAGALP